MSKEIKKSKKKNNSNLNTLRDSTNKMILPNLAPVQQESFDKLDVVQKDWVERDWIDAVNASMKKVVDFLNKFGIFFVFLKYFLIVQKYLQDIVYQI